MYIKKIAPSLFLMLFVYSGAVSQTFDEIVDRIVSGSPSLSAMDIQNRADEFLLKVENSLEDPEISFEALFGPEADNKYNVSVSQGFDWPGVYSAKKRAATIAGEVARARLACEQRVLRLQASRLLTDIIAAKKRIGEYEKIAANYTKLVDVSGKEFEKGNISILDYNKMRIEKIGYDSKLNAERSSLAGLIAELKTLAPDYDIEGALDSFSEFPAKQLSDESMYIDRAMDHNPEIILSRLESQAALSEISVAKRSALPGFSLGYRFSHEDNTVYNGFTFGMKLPVWGATARESAAKASFSAAVCREQNVIETVKAKISGDYRSASLMKQQMDGYGAILATTDYIAFLDKAFAGGQINLSTYIQEVNYFTEANIGYIDLQSEYNKLLNTLEAY